MKTIVIYFVLFFMLTLTSALFCSADSKNSKEENRKGRDKIKVKEIIYRPPFRGAPKNRVFGGTRGSSITSLALEVLTPEHTGLTIEKYPTLYWFISEQVSQNLEITINQANRNDPILDIRLKEPVLAGINKINLGDYGLSLLENMVYQWSVALILDETNRSKDIVSTGYIKRTTLTIEITPNWEADNKQNHPGILAEKGIWYDALRVLSDLITENPKNAFLGEKRVKLLEQVGLNAAAKFERKRLELAQ